MFAEDCRPNASCQRCSRGHSRSHRLFADDYIVFSEASQRGTIRLQQILEVYSKGSGQLVNWDKSSVFFSTNCEESVKQVVRQELHINAEALSDRYLGLSTAVGSSTSEAFDFMPTRIKGI
jgi:hypothetical protein